MSSAGELVSRLGLPVSDLSLFERALVHGSYTNEHPEAPIGSNERLEFLGDAVISVVISEALYERHPDEDEGALTARRAALVSTDALASAAGRLGLGELLLLGQGAERAGERQRASVLAATFEAVVAAVYLDQGYEASRAWLTRLLADLLEARTPLASLKAPKSRLQEIGYMRWGSPPTYRVVSAAGPDHARRYVVEALVGEQVLGRGEGTNRRHAETEAAARALEALEREGDLADDAGPDPDPAGAPGAVPRRPEH
ncbi:MAG: ribonuclease III [Candidatus Limnocylindrales bacterium]